VALGNLASRFLVAVVAAPVLILAFYVDTPLPTWGIVFAASLLAMWELFTMTLDDKNDRLAALGFGALTCLAFYWIHPAALPSGRAWQTLAAGGSTFPVLFLGVIAPGLYYLFRFRDMSTVATRYASTVFGIFYAGVLLTCAAALKRDGGGNHGGDWILFVLVVMWLGDTGAYFAGRFLGKHKLYEAVSPKKTWEGAFGGIAGSLLAAIVMKLTRFHDALPGSTSSSSPCPAPCSARWATSSSPSSSAPPASKTPAPSSPATAASSTASTPSSSSPPTSTSTCSSASSSPPCRGQDPGSHPADIASLFGRVASPKGTLSRGASHRNH
jgi:phosphatidate cytidylyltransferase